jgi:hypothetical protein
MILATGEQIIPAAGKPTQRKAATGLEYYGSSLLYLIVYIAFGGYLLHNFSPNRGKPNMDGTGLVYGALVSWFIVSATIMFGADRWKRISGGGIVIATVLACVVTDLIFMGPDLLEHNHRSGLSEELGLIAYAMCVVAPLVLSMELIGWLTGRLHRRQVLVTT